jgi:2-iminobutanoate/2-iminopropanoate deaminase
MSTAGMDSGEALRTDSLIPGKLAVIYRTSIAVASTALILWGVLSACAGRANRQPTEHEGLAALQVSRKFIHPPEFTPGQAHTPGVLVGDTLYISGQIGADPRSGSVPSDVGEQTRQATENIGHVLRAAGMSYGNLVSCHVYLDDMEHYQAMNEAYGSFHGPDYYPARTTLEMPGLPRGSQVEISCIAFADKSRIEAVVPPEGSIPKAMGPYRPAVWAGNTLYVSGNGGRDPKTNQVVPSVAGQTKQAMENIGQILKAAGADFDQTVFTNAYYLGKENKAGLPGDLVRFRTGNVPYGSYWELGTAPSRATFQVARLPGTISVEITFIATRDLEGKGRVVPGSVGVIPTSSGGGVIANDTLYTSGKSGDKNKNFEGQLRGSFEAARQTLLLAGMDYENIVQVHVYLKDINDMGRVDPIFKQYFPTNPPARTTVQVLETGPREGILENIAVMAVR